MSQQLLAKETFNGKTVIITGSSGGIGGATALRFAVLGANVVITGRNESGLRSLVAECVAAGVPKEKVHVVIGDISLPEFRTKLVNEAVSKFGGINILVNNAAYNQKVSLFNISAEELSAEYQKTFQCNVEAVIDLSKKCIPYLAKSKGNIVNIASFLAAKVIDGGLLYGTSKTAVLMLSKSMAHELAAHGIRVNIVSPGAIDTPMLGRTMAYYAGTDMGTKIQQMKEDGGVGQVEDVARTITFVASDESKFFNGSELLVDGGFLIN